MSDGIFLQMFTPRGSNDLLPLLPGNVRFATAENAPVTGLIAAAKRGECRLFVECPDAWEGLTFGEIEYAEKLKLRSVVADCWTTLPVNRILCQHNFAFRTVKTPVAAHLCAARVAGYRDACFGLPEERHPLLFQDPDCPGILIATTPLSGFIRGRFAPRGDFAKVIGRILGFLAGDDRVHEVAWEQDVRPAFSAAAALPPGAEEVAFKRNAEWFYREMVFNYHGQIGVFEGFSSAIDATGRQRPMPVMRGDCIGEAALVTALDAAINREPLGRELSRRLLDTLFRSNRLLDVNAASQTYGSLFFDEVISVVYGDDNSRAAFGAVLAGELLDLEENVEPVIRLAYSLLRTTGANGLRRPSLSQPESFADGRTWSHYYRERIGECRPHYQAFQWAFFLQMYQLTRDGEFLESARRGIATAMAEFPDFRWQNGITGEWARILLPLAMLVEIDDTPLHRHGLDRAVQLLAAQLDRHGAVIERMGKPELGRYPAPQRNADFGVDEAALIQRNGDPAVDLLYTMNFAFIGMHEAAVAAGDARYRDHCDRMAEFLCRIQAASSAQPYLDGCWLRGFDCDLWEFFGSSADTGWGPWCVESGWTNAWIALTFGLRRLGRPLLCRAHASRYAAAAPKIREEMFGRDRPSTTRRGLITDVDGNAVPAN